MARSHAVQTPRLYLPWVRTTGGQQAALAAPTAQLLSPARRGERWRQRPAATSSVSSSVIPSPWATRAPYS